MRCILVYFFLKKYLPTDKNDGIGVTSICFLKALSQEYYSYKILIYGIFIIIWLLFDQFP